MRGTDHAGIWDGMTPHRVYVGFAVGLILFIPAASQSLHATTPSTNSMSATIDLTKGGTDEDGLLRPRRATDNSALGGNPLWTVPLSALSATREKPIFLPSRRPPAPVIASPAPMPAVKPSPLLATPEQPKLGLVGTIISTTMVMAILCDQATKDVVRLRLGQSQTGWNLRSIKGREVTFENGHDTAVIAIPAPPMAAEGGDRSSPVDPCVGIRGGTVVAGRGDLPAFDGSRMLPPDPVTNRSTFDGSRMLPPDPVTNRSTFDGSRMLPPDPVTSRPALAAQHRMLR